MNNRGYLSIRQTQDVFYAGRHFACDLESGVTFPDIIKVARAYGLATEQINEQSGIKNKIKKVLKSKRPIVCEVVLSPDQKFIPRVASEKRSDGTIVSKPLEDMYPFLGRQEFNENMIVSKYKKGGNSVNARQQSFGIL